MDGVDLFPFVRGTYKGMPHERLYWRFRGQRAIRRGDWKLMTCNGEYWLLFNLADDPFEEHDLSAERPQLARELYEEWKEWDAQMIEALWMRSEAHLDWLEDSGGRDPTTRPAGRVPAGIRFE